MVNYDVNWNQPSSPQTLQKESQSTIFTRWFFTPNLLWSEFFLYIQKYWKNKATCIKEEKLERSINKTKPKEN